MMKNQKRRPINGRQLHSDNRYHKGVHMDSGDVDMKMRYDEKRDVLLSHCPFCRMDTEAKLEKSVIVEVQGCRDLREFTYEDGEWFAWYERNFK